MIASTVSSINKSTARFPSLIIIIMVTNDIQCLSTILHIPVAYNFVLFIICCYYYDHLLAYYLLTVI